MSISVSYYFCNFTTMGYQGVSEKGPESGWCVCMCVYVERERERGKEKEKGKKGIVRN